MKDNNVLPIVSVIIPTYNYAHLISDAINSIINQDYPNEKIEIIVVDDGSTDETRKVLEEFIKKDIIKYIFHTNRGKAYTTYVAICNCTGKYIFNLDADDLYYKDKISQSVKIFELDPSIVHVSSPAQITFQSNGESTVEKIPIEILDKPLDGNLLLKMFYENNILYGGGSTYSVRANVIKQISIPESVNMYIDEFMILATLPFGKSYFLSSPLSIWRVHNSNYSGKQSNEIHFDKGTKYLIASSAILNYLIDNDFDEYLIKIYTLKNLVRIVSLKEDTCTKSLCDIYHFIIKVLFEIKPSYRLIKKYYVINRLLPLNLYKFLKKISNEYNHSIST